MTQPDTGARKDGERVDHSHAGQAADQARPADPGRPPDPALPASAAEPARSAEPARPARPARPAGALPPGQYIPRTLPVLHYGPVPAFREDSWDLRIFGATATAAESRLRWPDVERLPFSQMAADFHCVTKFSVPGVDWGGVLTADVLRLFPPSSAVTHVMIWAEFGYSANVRIGDFAADDTMLATHRDGAPLTPEHGYPLRLVVPSLYAWKSVKWVRAIEYLTVDRRGFWEERGYHNTADPWQEQRYSYQETDGEGPPL
jgi:DMSO/TMAO reductase YedYZ molybdopterin-dependent catalytic subunit